MKKRFYLYLLSVCMVGILLAGCAPQPRVPQMRGLIPTYTYIESPRLPREIIPVYGFNEVIISGAVSTEIKGHSLQNQLAVSGTVEALKEFTAQVRQGVLYINAREPVNVSLRVVTPLRKITYRGNRQLSLKDLGKQSMVLVLGGNSRTTMRGELVLSRIMISDNASLNAYWVDSSNLHIMAKNHAKLFLAGVVTALDIIASGNAEIDAKALRVENAYVRTEDNANVGVTVKRALGTLSTGRSTVYYYRDSHVGMLYLSGGGSALRMVGIPQKNG